jgi:hypothetical protein
MEFRKFSAGLNVYGRSDSVDMVTYEKGITNVNFFD